MRRSVVLLLLIFHALSLGAAAEPAYQYFLTGDPANVTPRTSFGVFLAGGGKDQDAGFEWFLNKAGNGDIVILRASGGDGYHGYLQKLRPQVNSIETILFRSREASSDPVVLEKIRNADGLFLAGGDQWNYIRYWKDSPVEDAIHELVARGVPVGGTSAGLAVLGEFAFSAEHDTVRSPDALADPFHPKVTIATGFLRLPHLGCVITDSHFKQRDRMGRLLVFLARIRHGESRCRTSRGIAIDERTAVLMEADGSARVVGEGEARFLELATKPKSLSAGTPITTPDLDVYAAGRDAIFDLSQWQGRKGRAYRLRVQQGQVITTGAGGSFY
jgi:cyanophycinase